MVKIHLDRKELLTMAFALLAPASSVFGFSYIDLGLYTRADTGIDAGVHAALETGVGEDMSKGTNTATSTDAEAKADRDLDSAVTIGEDEVIVSHEQPGRLLALFPVTLKATATLHADGSVEVNYPWYAFLVNDNRKELEEEIKAAVTPILAARSEGNATLSSETAALAAAAMTDVLSQNLEADAEANLTR